MNINIQQLEIYSQQHPQEVLIVTAEEGDSEVEIMIFKGFSSNLTGSTEFDPDKPILSPQARIINVDRLFSPYNPINPLYIQQNLTPSEIASLLLKN